MESLDLNEILVQRPAATFFVRMDSDSMKNSNIYRGDVLIVDRSLTPRKGNLVVAVVDGACCVRKIEHPQWDFEIWGTVTYVIHKML